MLGLYNNSVTAASSLGLVIDGRRVSGELQPALLHGRTLVPVRLVAERLGAEVEWIDEQNAVRIVRADRTVVVRIDSHLVESSTGVKAYTLSDVAPLLIGGRTYVPLRLVANALGVDVRWDEPTNTVYVDSRKGVGAITTSAVRIATVNFGQVLTSRVSLRASFSQPVYPHAKEIRYLMLDTATGNGVIIARGASVTATYEWLPDLRTHGPKILVAALYDERGQFIAGDAIPVEVALTPEVKLNGLSSGQYVGTAVLSADINFSAAAVTYEFTSLTTGKTFTTPKSDPLGTYSWAPQIEDNGVVWVKPIAHSITGKAYAGEPVAVNVNVLRRLELRGVSAGATIEKPVNLSISANFSLSSIEYILRDPLTGSEQSLAQASGGYRFFPSTTQAGKKELYAKVKDASGATYSTPAVAVTISNKGLLLISGIGPGQVVTGSLDLTALSNTNLESVRYMLVNKLTGVRTQVGSAKLNVVFKWTPTQEGEWSLQAEGIVAGSAILSSEVVSFKVYLGTVYGARPIVPQNQFLDLASNMAVASRKQTGMSAALQTAQAILETGWGQSVPVDKYSGHFSNNLFGIKGTGPAGSVTSNTWEEYNGVAFRVDAAFRAYHSLEQGWDDHKNLLLTAQRYQPLRDVMYDSTLGAWALRRAGYATDSQYPIKLIDIINRYDLWKLDEVSI